MQGSFEERIVNDITPKWIRDLKEEDEGVESARERESQENQIATLKIRTEAPDFWKQVLKEIQINVDGLAQIGLRASVSPAGPNGCHVEVARTGTMPKIDYTNVFCSEQPSPRIRLHDMENAMSDNEIHLLFGVHNDQLIVMSPLPPRQMMNAEQTAEYIVKRLVRKVRQ